MGQAISLKKNFIFNIILTLSTYLAQLIVYPYVSRVLGVDNMGVIGFVNKTIDVFLIFSTLGIATVGVREIASNKNDKEKLNDVFSSLVSICVVSTILVSVIYLLSICIITKFNTHCNLFLIGFGKLIFSTFLVEWFYQGIEKFKFIAIRSLVIKLIYIISVFIFVRDSDDTQVYFLLTTVVVVLNGVINWYASRNHVHFTLCFNNWKLLLYPLISFGVYQFLNAAFSTFNYVFLGFICDNKEVGYYYTAENFYFILLACISAFTRVMLPRMSSLLSERKTKEFNILVDKSVNLVLSVCLPIAIYGVFFASSIVKIFSGNGYEGAVVPLQIMLALVLINGLNQIFIVQIATPMKLDKEILVGTLIATIIALPSNYFMIKSYGAIGCSIVLVVSVIIANIYPIYTLFSRNLVKIQIKNIIHHLLKSLPYIIIALVVSFFDIDNTILQLIVAGIPFGLYFLLVEGKKLLNSLFGNRK